MTHSNKSVTVGFFLFLLEIVNRSFQQWLHFCLGGLESSLLEPQSDIFLPVPLLSNYYLSTVAAHFWPYLFFFICLIVCVFMIDCLRKISAVRLYVFILSQTQYIVNTRSKFLQFWYKYFLVLSDKLLCKIWLVFKHEKTVQTRCLKRPKQSVLTH